ncbi:gamma carbonic anhydrase family protein [Arenicella chitinivorans]|uniref:Gamma carbonic anhydrase family protein n=1 Tax=Arenicella chitinivorans TaxID=1329800 RepID=A0A918RLS1_9GAMM|nr:gamma carbonic anhydrase family protein [Arenicella chitinivorans]GHA04627.1 gamma carbonic anhydrase family protein [Arenicella chitinivorans]
MIFKLDDTQPEIADTCFVAPSASLIGAVKMAANASVWFNCVLRADNEPIVIGENSNVQDGSVLHVDPGYPIEIAANVTIGHKVMLHGCVIGEGTLIGMNAVVLNGARIGRNCLIGANALVTENMEIPDGSMVLGSPAKVVKTLDEKLQVRLAEGAKHYVDNGARYRTGLVRIDD